MANSLRREVLSLYKRIMRVGRTWNSLEPSKTAEDKQYIQKEARFWFRKNSQVTEDQAIKDHIREGEARLEMALHYRNPYPRPVNLPPKSITRKEGKKSLGKVQDRLMQQSRPVYVKSPDSEAGLGSSE